MLKINNLQVEIDNVPILKGIDLQIGAGEVHAIMGPNGSGKSTLANVLAGREEYQITQGEIQFQDESLLELSVEDRAKAGLFLSFQYPAEIAGVNNLYFLKTIYNNMQKHRGKPEMDAMDFIPFVKDKMKQLEMDEMFLQRSVNEGFSGGEKKRNEILQMLLLSPTLAILDEVDSGLDIDALQIIAKGINMLRHAERSFILVTHYQRLLHYIQPDHIHILLDGRIVKSGDASLALELEEKGYNWIRNSVEAV